MSSINNSLLSRAIRQAQSKVEDHNFDIRKHLVEYDDVMNKHRTTIYRRRQQFFITMFKQPSFFIKKSCRAMTEQEQKQYQDKAAAWPEDLRGKVEQTISLRTIDVLWIEHLKNLEDLSESIGLRGYGQREPIVEYKREAYQLLKTCSRRLTIKLSNVVARFLEPQLTPVEAPQPVSLNSSQQPESPDNDNKKISRNDPCPCG